MKRLLAGILTAALVLSIGTTTALAAGHGRGGCGGGRRIAQAVCAFIDNDGDGICDNCGVGCGGNYVDSDGDGVCDNYASGSCPQIGAGRGCGGRRGCGRW